MSHRILIALGSNSRQSAHIQWASQRLSLLLDQPLFSRTLWTPDNSGNGKMYMNRLVSGYTHLTTEEIEQNLKAIEAETHRTTEAVTIDLDLMAYDDCRYHLRDWPRPYIQELLALLQHAC